jgi:hypothetical protein
MQKSLSSDWEISHDRIFFVHQTWLGAVIARIDGADAHLAHQSNDSLVVHKDSILPLQDLAHEPAAIVGVVSEDLVDAVHQLDRRLGLRPGHVVVARATDFQELALSAY